MAQYKKRPVVIEAVQWNGNFDEIYQFTDADNNYGIVGLTTDGSLEVRTFDGIMKANVGDYIIRGVKGEYYPCKPDIFEMTYESITMTQQTNYPNKMMSAVEWLCNELHKYINGESNFTGVEIREQAKQMEKEQIFDAYSWGECNIDNYGCKIEKNGAEQYYNEKYDRTTNPNQDY